MSDRIKDKNSNPSIFVDEERRGGIFMNMKQPGSKKERFMNTLDLPHKHIRPNIIDNKKVKSIARLNVIKSAARKNLLIPEKSEDRKQSLVYLDNPRA